MAIFTPPKSVEPYFLSDKFASFIVGPVGSTKTTASIVKIAYEAKKIMPCKDGIRRSRCAVVRNTRQMLFDTTIPDFVKWFPDSDAGVFMRTESKFLLKFDDIECEVLFRGLDDANDVRRLLSLQLTFGFMDEFREINPDIYNALTGRVGRYPDETMNGWGCVTEELTTHCPHCAEVVEPDKSASKFDCPHCGKLVSTYAEAKKVWGSTNPPDMDTFWEDLLSNPPANCSVTFQPSALSPEADWLHLLPSATYYENLAEGKSEDWIDIYIHGKFGKSLAGKPVFRAFDANTHVAKEPVHVLPQTVVIGVDAGLTPAAVFTQQTYDGRVVVHDAIAAFDMGAIRFIREKLKPLIANKYAGRQIVVIIDPAAFQRVQTDERSVADIFKAEGFDIKPAKTNSIAARIAAVESFLTRTVEGRPAILIDPGCTDLVRAMRGGYRYKINSKGIADDKPEKNEHSHVSDALQYAALHHDGGGIFGGTVMSQRREVKPAPRKWAV